MANPSYITPKNTSLEDKIGQMLMFGFSGKYTSDPGVKSLLNHIDKYKIGSILFLSENIESPDQLKELMNVLPVQSPKTPLWLAIDQEGGYVQRLSPKKGFKGYPAAFEVSCSLNLIEAESLYSELGEECNKYGFNLILAPVVDLNTNPDCPVIGAIKRSYSDNPEIVANYARAFVQGLKKNNQLGCLKHFPGHGSSGTDSHLDMTDITDTYHKMEILPYKILFEEEHNFLVMTSHIFDRKVDDHYPASLSKKHVTDNLRHQLGFNGVIITDDLQMGAIRKYFSLKEIIIQAIQAGNDILVFSQFFEKDKDLPEKVFDIITEAVHKGEIPEHRITESYLRITRQKKNMIF